MSIFFFVCCLFVGIFWFLSLYFILIKMSQLCRWWKKKFSRFFPPKPFPPQPYSLFSKNNKKTKNRRVKSNFIFSKSYIFLHTFNQRTRHMHFKFFFIFYLNSIFFHWKLSGAGKIFCFVLSGQMFLFIKFCILFLCWIFVLCTFHL